MSQWTQVILDTMSRISLTNQGQGAAATGGAKNYGALYEKDLGPETGAAAK